MINHVNGNEKHFLILIFLIPREYFIKWFKNVSQTDIQNGKTLNGIQLKPRLPAIITGLGFFL
jgi:hypothetical protein